MRGQPLAPLLFRPRGYGREPLLRFRPLVLVRDPLLLIGAGGFSRPLRGFGGAAPVRRVNQRRLFLKFGPRGYGREPRLLVILRKNLVASGLSSAEWSKAVVDYANNPLLKTFYKEGPQK